MTHPQLLARINEYAPLLIFVLLGFIGAEIWNRCRWHQGGRK